jgi:exonuclease SbcC
MSTLKADAALVPQIATAEARIVELAHRKADLDAQADDIVVANAATAQAHEDRILALDNEIAQWEDRLDFALGAKVNAKAAEIATAKANAHAAQQRLAELTARRQDLETNAALVEQATADVAEKLARHAKITTELAEWRYLQNACGKNGLQALEIEAAAPAIAGYANDLLARAFGPGYTLRFVTQDDEGREVLQIVATREDGEEVSIENLSGGEKVWSLKALRLAMAMLAKERSGKDFKAVFCDEEDGALDAGKAEAFVGMYRAFMDLGGFDQCFFISHRPESVAMADHVLTFTPGVGVVVQ